MNNNNEKTFADLFLNSKDDDVKDDNLTFDTFSNDVGSSDDSVKTEEALKKEKEAISFSGFNSMVMEDDLKVDNISTINREEEIKINDVDYVVDDVKEEINLFDVATDLEIDSKNVEDIIKSEEVVKNVEDSTENKLDDNNVVNDSIIDNISDVKIDLEVEDNKKIEEDNVNTLDINNDIIKEENLEESFLVNDASEEVNKEKFTEEEKKEEISIDSNIFVLEDSNSLNDNTRDAELQTLEENKDNIVNDNNIVENVGSENIETTDLMIEESSKELNDIKEVNDDINFDNPFVGGTSDFVIGGPLFNNVISLEQTDNSTKKVNKLDLSKTKHFGVKVVAKKEPLTKFIIGVISYAFFIWLLLIGITLLVYVLDIKIRAAKGDYSPPVFNAYVVLTGSMLPEIQVNDVVVTKRVDVENLDVGDIITFASTDSRFAGTIITHRIIKKNPSKDGEGVTFQTKGDNNNVADSALVKPSNIYGKVILKIPKLGYLQEFLATDGGWIVVILIPCLTVISYDIVKLFKGLKRKKYNNIKVKK